MPKTPPLLIPTGPPFQGNEDAPAFQSFLPPLPPSNFLSSRLHQLDPVMEEENENSIVDDPTDIMDTYKDEESISGQKNDFFSKRDLLSTTSAAAQNTGYQQSTSETTNNGIKQTLTRQPSTLPFENDESTPKNDNSTIQSLKLAYESIVTKHQDFKEVIDSFADTLTQSEVDQRGAIQDLQSYKENLQARGERLHERWLQVQTHAQNILQVQPFSDDPSSQ